MKAEIHKNITVDLFSPEVIVKALFDALRPTSIEISDDFKVQVFQREDEEIDLIDVYNAVHMAVIPALGNFHSDHKDTLAFGNLGRLRVELGLYAQMVAREEAEKEEPQPLRFNLPTIPERK